MLSKLIFGNGDSEEGFSNMEGTSINLTPDIMDLSDTKSSRTTGVGPEFTYGQASSTFGAQGIPQPQKLFSYENYARLYGSSVWVYACVYTIASSIAGIPLTVFKKPTSSMERLEPLDDPNHPLVQLFNSPNPFMTMYDFIEALLVNLELTGNSYLEEVKDGDVPIELYPLQSQRMYVVPDKTEMIKGYLYKCNAQGVAFDRDEITHIKYHNPTSDFYGASPLASAEIAVLGDMEAEKYNRNFFKNSARPDAILETDQNLNSGSVNRLRAEFNRIYQGVSKSHKVAILEGGLKYKQVSLTSKDMDFINLRKLNRDEIFTVYKVPASVLGITEKAGAGKANLDEQKKNFWENTLLPKMEKIELILNRDIVAPFGDDVIVRFDRDKIEALKENREVRARIGAMLTDRGIMTINEVRAELFNKPAVDWGDTWHMPLNLQPVDQVGNENGTTGPGSRDVPDRGTGRPSEEDETLVPSATSDGPRPIYSKDSIKGTLSTGKVLEPFPPTQFGDKIQTDNRKKAFLEVHGKLEDDFVKDLNKVFKKEESRIVKAIKAGQTSTAVLDKLIDQDKELFRSAAEVHIEKIVAIAGNSATKEVETRANELLTGKSLKAKQEEEVVIPVSISFDVFNEDVISFIKERSFDFWGDVSNTTKEELKTALRKATEEGLSIDDTVLLIQEDVFKGVTEFEEFNRARKIARTESTISLNQGADFAYKQSGVVDRKSWLTSADEVVRSTHLTAEAEGPIDYDKEFSNGLKFPGDPEGDAKEVVNCRCTLIPEIDISALKSMVRKNNKNKRNK